MASSERFGYEWDKYDFILPEYELQFLKWVTPLTKEDFRDKTVLDAGCGMGRNLYWPLTYGARSVVGFDLDDRSLAAAKKLLGAYPNATITKGDIKTFDSDQQFDIVFSIGVVHHLRQPETALANLARLVKPGGKLLIWVYGYEGNEWIVRYVNPVRTYITSKLPLPIVHFLSYGASIPLFLFVKLFPQKSGYYRQLKEFTFRHIHAMVFDQLIPSVANYWKQEEVISLMRSIKGIRDIQCTRVNDMSWTAAGIKEKLIT